jgi:hypothetical protein
MTSTGPADPDADELIRRLERTLGIAVLIESVETVDDGDGSVTIEASLMAGSNGTHVAVTGDSEERAWEELARAAIAWRNADFQHIKMWPGGG